MAFVFSTTVLTSVTTAETVVETSTSGGALVTLTSVLSTVKAVPTAFITSVAPEVFESEVFGTSTAGLAQATSQSAAVTHRTTISLAGIAGGLIGVIALLSLAVVFVILMQRRARRMYADMEKK